MASANDLVHRFLRWLFSPLTMLVRGRRPANDQHTGDRGPRDARSNPNDPNRAAGEDPGGDGGEDGND